MLAIEVTAEEMAKRVDTIVTLMGMGFTRREIIQFASTKTDPPWRVTETQINKYITQAKKTLEGVAKINEKLEAGVNILRLEDLYKRNIAIQDYKGALAAQKEKHTTLATTAGIRFFKDGELQ